MTASAPALEPLDGGCPPPPCGLPREYFETCDCRSAASGQGPVHRCFACSQILDGGTGACQTARCRHAPSREDDAMTPRLHCFGESGNAYKAALTLTLAGDRLGAGLSSTSSAARTRTPDYRALNVDGRGAGARDRRPRS